MVPPCPPCSHPRRREGGFKSSNSHAQDMNTSRDAIVFQYFLVLRNLRSKSIPTPTPVAYMTLFCLLNPTPLQPYIICFIQLLFFMLSHIQNVYGLNSPCSIPELFCRSDLLITYVPNCVASFRGTTLHFKEIRR